MKSISSFIIIIFLLWTTLPSLVSAIEKPADELQEVGIVRNLGGRIEPSLEFVDSTGEKRTFSQLLASGKPTMLVPVYYECPRLCGLLLNGVTTLLNELDLDLGAQYQVLTVSFDSSEGTELAAKRQNEYRARIQKTGSDTSSWHFLVGDQSNVIKLMTEVGFQYKKDGEDFAHTAAVIILTPDGEISQYFTGIDFSAWDVRLALIEASQGKVGSLLDQVLLFCFRYDHLQGRYTWAAFNFVRLGAILSVVAVLSIIFISARRRARDTVQSCSAQSG